MVESARDQTRARIIRVAADLLAQGGRQAVTTRSVAAGAGVQAPTIYRLFGDKDGLLDAVAEHGFQAHLAEKVIRPTGGDPVDDLRAGWDLHIGFGLANPALYALMYGDPRPPAASPANAQAFRVLRAHVRRVAEVGRLRVGEEHAVNLVHASGCGTVLTLLAMPEEHRDPALSELAREAVIAAITTDAPTLQAPGPVGAAAALRAVLDETEKLTVGERGVLKEWLDRITAG
jgi:AcrR family transcriptional regulator